MARTKSLLERKLSQMASLSAKLSLRASVLKSLATKNITTVEELIYFLPRKYEDRSSLLKLAAALRQTQTNETFITTIIAECFGNESFQLQNRNVLKYFFTDGVDNFSVTAFNPMHRFHKGKHYILSGKLKIWNKEVQLTLHESEVFDEEAIESLNSGRVVPIYSSLDKISQKKIRQIIKDTLSLLPEDELNYAIDKQVLETLKFHSKKENILAIHFPNDFAHLEKARSQLAYEELYKMQKSLAEKSLAALCAKPGINYPHSKLHHAVARGFPFQLTFEQQTVVKAIVADMRSSKAMNRLLQGEVGSGKTVVALVAMVLAAENGCQAAFMVPTDVLAKQHFQFIKAEIDKLTQTTAVKQNGNTEEKTISVHLMVAQQSDSERKDSMAALEKEQRLIVVGTHALIQDKVNFKNLRLAVIDEQHRFGVEQREALKGKSQFPQQVDFLSLSATPIPRSLSLTLFGDMDRSEIRLRAAALTDVQSKVIYEQERPHAYRFLLQKIKAGQQGFVVFPVIEESATGKLKSLLKEYQELKKLIFRGIPTAFIHGKMHATERDKLMDSFRAGVLKVLFCTTVLEVGIDCPNATVMIIESANQFGLSQLHQLRGRVGRHDKPGFCYLVGKRELPEETQQRLHRFAQTKNGFEIAEIDLQTRGPGEMAGTRQSGFLQFHFADLSKDFELLVAARTVAFKTVAQNATTQQKTSPKG